MYNPDKGLTIYKAGCNPVKKIGNESLFGMYFYLKS